jgi:hypothetical protein
MSPAHKLVIDLRPMIFISTIFVRWTLSLGCIPGLSGNRGRRFAPIRLDVHPLTPIVIYGAPATNTQDSLSAGKVNDCMSFVLFPSNRIRPCCPSAALPETD